MKFTTIKRIAPLVQILLRKSFLIMKIVILLLIGSFLQVHANSYGQITLNEKHSPLEKVLDKIKKQTGFNFIYDEKKIIIESITVSVSDASIEKTLEACFKGLPVTFSIINNNIIIKPADISFIDKLRKIFSDPVHLTGKITDSAGIPLARATIFFIRHNAKMPAGYKSVNYITNESGLFYFDADEGDEIGVSYIGYQTYQFTVRKGMPFQNIVLNISASRLDEVIVNTGYQKLSKDRATGAFGKPDMQTFIQRLGTEDIVNRLDGLIPGLTLLAGPGHITSNQNGNGASSQQSLIRGTTSLQLKKDPYYIVNGVKVSDFSAINPNDIADITVLKDASALSIYGANAANGVIVVTTKSGKEQKLKINYAGYLNFQGKPDFEYISRHLLSSSEYIQAAKEIFDPSVYPISTLGTSYIAPHEQFLYNQNSGIISESAANFSLDSLSRINNLGQIKKLWYQNAYTMNHTLSLSGGNSIYNFYTSLSYIDNRGNQIGASGSSYSINLTQSITPNKWFRATVNTAIKKAVNNNSRPAVVDPGFLPYQLFQDFNGNNLLLNYTQGLSAATRADYQARSLINLDYSPLDEINSGYTKSNNLNINTSADIGIKLWKGLSFNGTYGYQLAPGTNTIYDDHSLYAERRLALAFTIAPTTSSVPIYNIPVNGGRYQTGTNDQRNWTVRNQLIYNSYLRGGKDRLNVQIGHEAQEQLSISNNTIVRGYDLNLQSFTALNYAILSRGIFGGVSSGRSILNELPYSVFEARMRFTSYFGLLNYSLDQKYDFDASIRADHSNLFGVDVSGQKKPTYSIGGKWQISRESFMSAVKWVQNLSLRATYGVTGNSPYVGAAATVDILQAENDPTTGNSFSVNKPPNRKLSFEKTQNYNFGIDFSLLNNRLNGSIDFYKKNTFDLLNTLPVNPLNGFPSTIGNLGNLTNKGIEVSLNTINIRSKEINWVSTFVFSYNKNMLVSYDNPSPVTLTDTYRLGAPFVAGYNSSSLFAYQYAGLDNLGDPQIRLADGSITKTPGVAKATDLRYMGSTLPKFNGGLSNTIRYRQFSVSANLIYNLGSVMRRDANNFFGGRLTGQAGSFTNGNINVEFLERWQKPGDEAKTNVPSYVSNQSINFFRRSVGYYTNADINVISASYIKLRDMTLSYELSSMILKRLRVESFRLFLQTGNYMVWKANKFDIDPEYHNLSSGTLSLPLYGHTYSVGANVSF